MRLALDAIAAAGADRASVVRWLFSVRDRDSPPNRGLSKQARIAALHERWRDDRHRAPGPGYRDEWYERQCGGCLHYRPLAGELGLDWGACTNGRSPCDRRVMFEHDGCDEFEADPAGWGGARMSAAAPG